MTPPSLDRAEVARLLRQRAELGGGAAVFERISREGVLAAAREGGVRLPTVGAAEGRTESSDRGGDGEVLAGGLPKLASLRPAETVPPPPRPAPPPEALPERYEALREAALLCTRCRLSQDRTQVVFSDGNPEGRLMVVGEAPGAQEDRTGLPFVGPAGKLLDLLLASVDLSRATSVYICNVIKCRPPGNRNPAPDEIAACAPYLRRQIEIVRPEAILALGTFAAQLLTATERPLGKLRGEVYSYEGIPLVVTYHPAALLRNSGWIRPTWDDFQLISQILDSRSLAPVD